jgi:lipopolysaccharide biosynthesis regulator YciM
LYETFSALTDNFFDKKKAFFEKLKEKQGKSESRKEALIEKAEQLKDSKDWKNTGQKLIDLQKEWKKIPPAHFKIENKLWERFRSACDTFFEAKKQYFDTLDDRKEANLKVKESALELLKKATDKEGVVEALEKWHNAFEIPSKSIKKVSTELEKTAHEKAKELAIKDVEAFIFKAKVKAIKNADNSEVLIQDEKRFIV